MFIDIYCLIIDRIRYIFYKVMRCFRFIYFGRIIFYLEIYCNFMYGKYLIVLVVLEFIFF